MIHEEKVQVARVISYSHTNTTLQREMSKGERLTSVWITSQWGFGRRGMVLGENNYDWALSFVWKILTTRYWGF